MLEQPINLPLRHSQNIGEFFDGEEPHPFSFSLLAIDLLKMRIITSLGWSHLHCIILQSAGTISLGILICNHERRMIAWYFKGSGLLQ
jgi:hypothetical protein